MTKADDDRGLAQLLAEAFAAVAAGADPLELLRGIRELRAEWRGEELLREALGADWSWPGEGGPDR